MRLTFFFFFFCVSLIDELAGLVAAEGRLSVKAPAFEIPVVCALETGASGGSVGGGLFGFGVGDSVFSLKQTNF